MTTIGFFGDSFCSEQSNDHSISHGYTTYIQQLLNHNNAELVHLGVPGSSIWDTMLLQFMPLKDNPPDISVFVWTGAGRLFHRKERHINFSSAFNKTSNPVMLAAQEYYLHLFDDEKAELEHTAALMLFDKMLSEVKNTRIIHLWSFGLIPYKLGLNNLDVYKNISYNHDFKTGIEIRPPLMTLSYTPGEDVLKSLKDDRRANHIEGAGNDSVFSWIQTAIESCP